MLAARSAKMLTASALGVLLALAEPAAATTIGFDDLLGGGATDLQISNEYAGFSWNNFYVLDTVLYASQINGPSGYSNGVVSLNNVGFTGHSDPASFSSAQPFELDSFYIGAGWNDDMSVTITGLRNGAVAGSDILIIGTQQHILFAPHWSGIDTVTITPTGGTNHGYAGSGANVYLDNMVVNAPEPGTLAIFGFCLATTVLLRRRMG